MALSDPKPLERFYEKAHFTEEQESFDAFVENWRSAFGEALDPAIEFHEPALPGMPPQIFRGADEILEGVVRPLRNTVKELRIDAEELIPADDAVIVLGHFRGTTATGRELAVRFANIWRIKDGRAVRHDAYSDTAAFMHAMGFV
jgi:ketosteroid isomerase-like protein